ncbi:hypothetical protein C8J57DRAFT_1345943 [Mycena rebaudengoi]|nr:hypothetical protein C8J57DRAFT_1345943 [Mycena rebaudengoi]
MTSPNIPELVIRKVTPEITTFSKPFTRFGIPVGGRSTAIKLSTGDVWVLASTPLTQDTIDALDQLGPVKWIMGADAVHHMFLGPFKKQYPAAKVIGVEALIEKKKAEGMTLDGAYGADAPGTTYGFEDEIDACYFSGFGNKDVAWFHKSSKTLIFADLMFNLPGTEQYSKSKTNPRIPILGKIDPYGSVHKHFVKGQGKDKDAMARDAKTVLGWGPKRIIMCHGDVIENKATEAWATAYSKFLN